MANTSILAAFERMWQHTLIQIQENNTPITNEEIDTLFSDET